MRSLKSTLGVSLALGLAAAWAGGAVAGETPVKGGILKFVVGSVI